jgi:hypothetical protein
MCYLMSTFQKINIDLKSTLKFKIYNMNKCIIDESSLINSV